MRPAGSDRAELSQQHSRSVFLVSRCVSIAALAAAVLGIGAAARHAAALAAPPLAAAAKPAVAAKGHAVVHHWRGRRRWGRSRYRRYSWRGTHAAYGRKVAVVAKAKPGSALKPVVAKATAVAAAAHAPQRPVRPVMMVSRSAARPLLVSSTRIVTGPSRAAALPPPVSGAAGTVATAAGHPAGAAAAATAQRRVSYGRRSWRWRRRRSVTHPMNVAAILASPVITRAGNLVEPLSNGLMFSMPRPVVETRYGTPDEQVGAQIRYANFGLEYSPKVANKVDFVALQHDVRLNCKLGTGSTKADVEKVFGKLDHHNDVIYQKYLLHFALDASGMVDVVTVAPAPGRPAF